MPTYEYGCRQCGKEFSLVMTMAEHDRNKVVCPEFRSRKVDRRFSTFYARTSKKS